jgi:hypothetical protein
MSVILYAFTAIQGFYFGLRMHPWGIQLNNNKQGEISDTLKLTLLFWNKKDSLCCHIVHFILILLLKTLVTLSKALLRLCKLLNIN